MQKAIRYVQRDIEDLAFTNRSSRVTIWGYPHIVGDVGMALKILTRAEDIPDGFGTH